MKLVQSFDEIQEKIASNSVLIWKGLFALNFNVNSYIIERDMALKKLFYDSSSNWKELF